MARAVAIVLAFGPKHEAGESVGLADGVEAVAAPGQKLVDIGLMTDVEDKVVGRRVENGVERYGQFHHAQVRAKMAARLGQYGDKFLADFLGQGRELIEREFLDVSR